MKIAVTGASGLVGTRLCADLARDHDVVRIGSITAEDDPAHPSVAQSSGWLPLNEEQRFARYRATWMSHADLARLVRCICARDVAFAIVYGVSDNATRFWDLEPGRAIFGFWPQDSAT